MGFVRKSAQLPFAKVVNISELPSAITDVHWFWREFVRFPAQSQAEL
jgi:hypothetical protein